MSYLVRAWYAATTESRAAVRTADIRTGDTLLYFCDPLGPTKVTVLPEMWIVRDIRYVF